MEHGLVAMLLVLSTWLFLREQRTGVGLLSAITICLLEASRPEGFMFVLLFVGCRLLSAVLPDGKKNIRRDLLWLAILCLGVFSYELFGLNIMASYAEHGER
jgi:hypothetical protein